MEENKLELKIRQFLLSSYALHRELLMSPSTEVLRRSQSFRENLLATVELDGENDSVQKKIVDSVHSLEKSFHICEIFCLGDPAKELSLELARWLKANTNFFDCSDFKNKRFVTMMFRKDFVLLL